MAGFLVFQLSITCHANSFSASSLDSEETRKTSNSTISIDSLRALESPINTNFPLAPLQSRWPNNSALIPDESHESQLLRSIKMFFSPFPTIKTNSDFKPGATRESRNLLSTLMLVCDSIFCILKFTTRKEINYFFSFSSI